MKQECLIIKNRKFLWWKWKYRYYNHDWYYKDTTHRKCLICNKHQILFKKNGEFEDWR